MRVDPFLSLTRMMKKKVRLKPTKYMLRKVKLSTYLSKLMKIEDCLLQSFKASFGGVFSKGGL
jgi:hypothetical protein